MLVLFLLVLFFRSCQSILDPLDFLSLQSIHKSLSDLPGSSFLSSWDFTSDPCTFPGVSCSSDRVVSLNLGDPSASSPGLTGRLHPALGRLSHLSELTLSPGRVFGPIPASLSLCSSLRFLALPNNFLSGDIPPGLSILRQLHTLDLGYNQLSGKIPPAIGALPELSNLVLCHNRLAGEVPPMSSAPLARLDLKHNNLYGGLSGKTLPASLRYLSLSSNLLSGDISGSLARLRRLEYLDLSINQFSGNVPGSLFSLRMSSLQLQRNLFSGPVRPLQQVMIRTVDLSYNRLTGEISPFFSTVENLYLNNNKLYGQVPGSFVDRLLTAEIEVLYLQHNFLTGIEINPTAEIPLSSSLCLQYNCMVPPVQTPCPVRAGKQKTRPTSQCGHFGVRDKEQVKG